MTKPRVKMVGDVRPSQLPIHVTVNRVTQEITVKMVGVKIESLFIFVTRISSWNTNQYIYKVPSPIGAFSDSNTNNTYLILV